MIAVRLVLAACLLFAATAMARADTYRIDPAHASIHWKVEHLGFSTMVGRFNRFSGVFTYDPDAPGKTPSVTRNAHARI